MPHTRESNSVVSRAFVGFQRLSEYGVSAVPSFRAGASAESQGDKGGWVRERVRGPVNKTLSSTLPAQDKGGFHMSLLTNAVIIPGNAMWPVSFFALDFEEGKLINYKLSNTIFLKLPEYLQAKQDFLFATDVYAATVMI